MNAYHIFFDADDTLWDEQGVLQHAERTLEAKLDELCGAKTDFARHFIAAENENIPYIGYGFPSYMFSLGETLASQPQWRTHKHSILRIVGDLLGAYTKSGPAVFPGVRETLNSLKGCGYRLHLLTRGLEIEQRFKLAQSGLTEFFEQVVVVARKDTSTYLAVLADLNVAASSATMVGNSVRADIAPAIQAGLRAIYVPAPTAWSHDDAEHPCHDRLHKVSAFSELVHVFQKLHQSHSLDS